jgi:GntR family transcriptional regulator, transcriptional repressor for pyruvate dehydrogenase complex
LESSVNTGALSAAITPIQKRDVTGLVVERLRMLLEKGVLEPGSKLPPEIEMSKLLGVSRPSLRQAYKALNILGIIRAIPGDGTYINESVSRTLAMPLTFLMLMKKISLGEVFEFRMMLEVELATLAATRASETEMHAMEAQLQNMTANLGEAKTESYLEAEYEFHNCITRAAHNTLLSEVIVIVGGLLWETRKRLVSLVPDRSKDLQQHRDIYLAVAARDAQAAGHAMRRHLQSAMELLKSDSAGSNEAFSDRGLSNT